MMDEFDNLVEILRDTVDSRQSVVAEAGEEWFKIRESHGVPSNLLNIITCNYIDGGVRFVAAKLLERQIRDYWKPTDPLVYVIHEEDKSFILEGIDVAIVSSEPVLARVLRKCVKEIVVSSGTNEQCLTIIINVKWGLIQKVTHQRQFNAYLSILRYIVSLAKKAEQKNESIGVTMKEIAETIEPGLLTAMNILLDFQSPFNVRSQSHSLRIMNFFMKSVPSFIPRSIDWQRIASEIIQLGCRNRIDVERQSEANSLNIRLQANFANVSTGAASGIYTDNHE